MFLWRQLPAVDALIFNLVAEDPCDPRVLNEFGAAGDGGRPSIFLTSQNATSNDKAVWSGLRLPRPDPHKKAARRGGRAARRTHNSIC